jgi:hypothetical protein
MSDTIQELADQAKTMVPDGLSVDEWVGAYNKALVGLVIDKCVEIMDQQERLPAGFLAAKAAHIHEYAIKTHFGIEALTRREQFRKDFEAVFKDGADLSGKDTP